MKIDPAQYSVLGVNMLHFTVGLIGGAVRSLSNTNRSLAHRIATAVTGAFAAGYLTPVVAPLLQGYFDHFGITLESTSGLTGFLLGIGGLSLCEGIIVRVSRVIGDR